MATLAGTYSSPFGGTQQGANQQNFMDILKTITGGAQAPMSPQVAQSGYQSALSSKLAMNEAQAPFMANAEQSLTQQSGIPQLQGQSADLSKLFEMYLADTGLAGKYSAPPTNPYTGGAANPYMGTPEQTVAAVTPTDTGAPGGGFTVPSLTTQAMGAPVSAANKLIDLVNQAIGVQQGRVKSKVGDVSTSYQKSLDTLDTLAKVFSDERDRAAKVVETSGNKELENKILEALNVINGDTKSSDVSGYERFALLQGETNAKRYAEEREKESGQEWAYRPAVDGSGWEVLRPKAAGSQVSGQLIKMTNWETGDEVQVNENDFAKIAELEMQGFDAE